MLPLLLAAVDVWGASLLAVKQGREPASAYAERASVAARRSGNPVVPAAAARAAATAVRRTSRTDEVLLLLHEAHAHLAASPRHGRRLEAAGLCGAYRRQGPPDCHRPCLRRQAAQTATRFAQPRLVELAAPLEATVPRCARWLLGSLCRATPASDKP
ncbi:hypothetical protein [Streptomyces sp. NPDC002553]|uniref:hypothetical protein n=1 Tax=Streptomyces sp. NPDC002553 TaxID=3154417 RepID=UPI003319D5B2